jgi:tRNA-dihydrouridine synthase
MLRFAETGCDAVHIGRGAIANPYIFRQTWETMQGLEPYQPPPPELHALLLEYLGYLREAMPEKGVIGRIKMLSAQFLRGVPNGAHLRTAVLRAQTIEEMLPLFDQYFALAEQFGIDLALQSARDEAAEAMECGA